MSYFTMAMHLIATAEDYRACVYNDRTGVAVHIDPTPGSNKAKATAGIGFNLEDTGLSFSECIHILTARVERIDNTFSKFAWYGSLEDARRAVVIDLIYNMGDAGFLEFNGTIKALATQNWQLAADHLQNTLWYKQVGRRGIRNVKIMREGKVTF